jgi:hypothetical protein
MEDKIIGIGGGGIFESLMEGLSITHYKIFSRKTGYDFSNLELLSQVFDESVDVNTSIFFTLDNYDGMGSLEDFTARELIEKNDLMFVNLLKLYQGLVFRKANYKVITVRGSAKFGKASELSYYEMLNRQTYEAIILFNTVCKNIDSYYLEIGLYSQSNTGRIFSEVTDRKYSNCEVNFDKLLICVRGILDNKLAGGYYRTHLISFT